MAISDDFEVERGEYTFEWKKCDDDRQIGDVFTEIFGEPKVYEGPDFNVLLHHPMLGVVIESDDENMHDATARMMRDEGAVRWLQENGVIASKEDYDGQ